MTHVTCRLTAKNRDQLRNPTLGNRVGYGLPLPFTSSPKLFTTRQKIQVYPIAWKLGVRCYFITVA